MGNLNKILVLSINVKSNIISIVGLPSGLYYLTAQHISEELTGNNRDIEIQGSMIYTDGPLGEADGAAVFDGTNYGRVNNIDGMKLSPAGSFTIIHGTGQ